MHIGGRGHLSPSGARILPLSATTTIAQRSTRKLQCNTRRILLSDIPSGSYMTVHYSPVVIPPNSEYTYFLPTLRHTSLRRAQHARWTRCSLCPRSMRQSNQLTHWSRRKNKGACVSLRLGLGPICLRPVRYGSCTSCGCSYRTRCVNSVLRAACRTPSPASSDCTPAWITYRSPLAFCSLHRCRDPSRPAACSVRRAQR